MLDVLTCVIEFTWNREIRIDREIIILSLESKIFFFHSKDSIILIIALSNRTKKCPFKYNIFKNLFLIYRFSGFRKKEIQSRYIFLNILYESRFNNKLLFDIIMQNKISETEINVRQSC